MFAQTVNLAYAVRLIDSNSPFALDGTKIKANAGRRNTKTREEYIQYQEEILQHVKNYLAKCEESDRQVIAESDKDTAKEFEEIKERIENLEIKKIQTKKTDEENLEDKKSDKNKKKLKEIDSIESAQGLLNLYEKIEDACEQNPDKKYINLTDTDSGLMKNKGIPQDSYNAEAISNNQIIVAADVTQDEQDQFQLKPMTEKLQKLLLVWEGAK